MTKDYPILGRVKHPEDLKSLDDDSLVALCKELREFIIDSVSRNGGHFAANLGVIELTVALHAALNTPEDKLIWDVGHQAYAHKIITDRKHQFELNRKKGGISGFPKMSESPYDAFGTGHSSTSISAALGMAVSARLNGDQRRRHVAVIGDGALTAGMAFEGLNHAGSLHTNFTVILNDNSMSIDPNVGALKSYLANLAHSDKKDSFREDILQILKDAEASGMDPDLFRKLESSTQQLMRKDVNFFESLNFSYFGPVDGHDVVGLKRTLTELERVPGPKLLHVLTLKGKGFEPAEKEQTRWHAPGIFDKLSGEIQQKKVATPEAPKFQDVFGHTLLELAQQDPKIVGITPAMPSGSSMNIMMEAIPERVFDVGIAEQHAVTFAAGLATDGQIPFCNLYSTFAQRAYDQIIHDVCVQNLPVIFCLDRAGLAGADGPTHHGAFDIAFLRCLPNLVVAAPRNEEDLRNLMFTAASYKQGPFSIRYPRGKGSMPEWRTKLNPMPIGKGVCLQEGADMAILSLGPIGEQALEAARELKIQGRQVGIYDMRFAKPIDKDLILNVAENYKAIITLEDGCLMGGFGSAVLEVLQESGRSIPLERIGLPDRFIEHGTQTELYADLGMDAKGIIRVVQELSTRLA